MENKETNNKGINIPKLLEEKYRDWMSKFPEILHLATLLILVIERSKVLEIATLFENLPINWNVSAIPGLKKSFISKSS